MVLGVKKQTGNIILCIIADSKKMSCPVVFYTLFLHQEHVLSKNKKSTKKVVWSLKAWGTLV